MKAFGTESELEDDIDDRFKWPFYCAVGDTATDDRHAARGDGVQRHRARGHHRIHRRIRSARFLVRYWRARTGRRVRYVPGHVRADTRAHSRCGWRTYCGNGLGIQGTSTERSQAKETAQARIDFLDQLARFMQTAPQKERIRIRLQLREELKQLVERIDIYPFGCHPYTPEMVEEVRRMFEELPPGMGSPEGAEHALAHCRTNIRNPDARCYKIYFRGGSIRQLTPKKPVIMPLDLDRERDTLYLTIRDRDGQLVTIEC